MEELKDRIAAVRKAAGLTQEQLGERVGVTRQAVSKWESGQTVPDALTVAALCQALGVSADYVLLGREPEEAAAPPPPAYEPPETCPCCGRSVEGLICPVCGYPLPTTPPRGPRYALVCTYMTYGDREKLQSQLVTYCGMPPSYAGAAIHQIQQNSVRFLLARNLTDGAVQYMAAHLDRDCFDLLVVRDEGEENRDDLLTKPSAMTLPPHAIPNRNGLGFWGVVGAVVVALLILSFL